MIDPSDGTMLITGATDGLGRQVAHDVAARGARVLVHGRSAERVRTTIEEISASTGNDRVTGYVADLAELAQVRRLAEDVRRDHDRVTVLVSNAGVGTAEPGGGRRMESADGFELRFAVNYLAGFLLTRLLLDRVVAGAPARIVFVSSAGQAPIDFGDVMLERHYSGVQAYCQSKLAQVMLTFDLAAELAGRGVTVNCLHPATYMPTKMVTAAGVTPVSSLTKGAHATERLILDSGLDGVSGRYFDGTREARAHSQAYDADARRRLRELSERLTGL